MKIEFNKSFVCQKSLNYVDQAIKSSKNSGGGFFSSKCEKYIEKLTGTNKCMITPSCTASLEMAALLLDIKKGDEIIMPSFTFVSTANAFVLRGAKPIFIDIREDTLNINEKLIESLINEKTKAIVVVHYAGVSCEMEKIVEIGKRYKIPIIEDAAQGFLGKYKNQYLGAIGDIGCYSFHATKNINCGEGGAILLNREKYIEKANIIRNKGTNINNFKLGLVDKYEWIDVGSSFLISEITSAYLLGQLEESISITNHRKKIWDYYHENLIHLGKNYKIDYAKVPKDCTQNYHIYFMLLKNKYTRDKLISESKKDGVSLSFHYIPLHTSKKGKFYKQNYDLPVSEYISNRIVRLPIYNSMKDIEMKYVIENIKKNINNIY